MRTIFCSFAGPLRRLALVGLASLTASTVAPLRAEDEPTIEISLQNDAFTPAEFKVPANRPFVLKVVNLEKSAVEIEATELKIEKVVAPGAAMIARVKPQKPGRYLLVNEYKEDLVKAFAVAE
jgi:hypothetical protein